MTLNFSIQTPSIATPLVVAGIALFAVVALHSLYCFFCDSRNSERKDVAVDRSSVTKQSSDHLIADIEEYVRELLGKAFPYHQALDSRLIYCLKHNRYYQLVSGNRPSAKQCRLICGVQLHFSLLIILALVAIMFRIWVVILF